jgi:hypothetical protein
MQKDRPVLKRIRKNVPEIIVTKVKNILPSIYLIVVANTKEATIGKGCKRDIKAIRNLFKKLSGFMHIQLNENLIQGDRYSQQTIMKAINDIKPKKNDCIVFYYSGHGFSYEKEKSQKFPQMDFRSNPADNKIEVINANTKNVFEIYELIKAKGARLNLVIADCCNSLIAYKRLDKSRGKVIEEKILPVNLDFCMKLFNGIGASVLVAAAKKGQYAISDDGIGSLFTYSLLKKIKDQVNSSTPIRNMSWDNLLKLAKIETLKSSAEYDNGEGEPSKQEAIFMVEKK